MKKRVVFGLSCWLAGALVIGSAGGLWGIRDREDAFSVRAGRESAGDIQKKIDETVERRKSVQQEKQELENDIAALEEKKGNILEYVEKLDGKLSELSEKIEANEEEILLLEGQVKQIRRKKKKAEGDQKKQYDTMAGRIRYMYENGDDGYLELLFGAGSLSELFNRVEYVNKVTDYDRKLLERYQKVCHEIQEMEEELSGKLDDLKSVKESLKLEKDSVDALMDKKAGQLKEYQSVIDEKTKEAEKRESLIRKQEEEMERLLEAQRKEIEREQEEAARKNKNDSSVAGTPDSFTFESSGGYGWPLAVRGRISSYFGYRNAPTAGASTYHKGIDIAVPAGTSVLAAQSGIVTAAAYSASAGNYIAIYHGNGIYTYYMHCSKLKVSVKSKVSKGQQIALSGNTGISTGPHLHFAVYANGAYVNPLKYVSMK